MGYEHGIGRRLLAGLALCALAGTVSAAVIVPADDPRIRYAGRFDRADPKRPRFDWPGTSIQARFTGPSVAVRLSGGRNDFNVFIDGMARPRVSLQDGKPEYVLASDLGPGEHTLILAKRTEAYYGIATFQGLVLADGHGLADPPPRPSRRLLFIGDSFTVGYGNESPSSECADLRPFDDNWQAYGPVAARALGAEYHVIAFSGLGMIHNYGDANPQSAEPLPAHFGRTLAGSAAPAWDSSAWTPQVVVVALGTNDFSTAVKPSEAQYAGAYRAFLKRLRSWHPAADIVCLTYAVDTYQARYVDAVVRDVKAAGDARVHRASLPSPGGDVGCHGHPDVAAHKRYAQALEPVLAGLLPPARTAWRPSWLAPGPGPETPESASPLFPDRREGAGSGGWSDARGRRLP